MTGNCHDPISYTLWFILKTLNLALHALDLRDLKRMFYKLKTKQNRTKACSISHGWLLQPVCRSWPVCPPVLSCPVGANSLVWVGVGGHAYRPPWQLALAGFSHWVTLAGEGARGRKGEVWAFLSASAVSLAGVALSHCGPSSSVTVPSLHLSSFAAAHLWVTSPFTLVSHLLHLL